MIRMPCRSLLCLLGCSSLMIMSALDVVISYRPLIHISNNKPLVVLHRRQLLIQSIGLVAATVLLPQQIISASSAADDRIITKPYAPLESLLPAVRVKRRIDRALVLAKALRDSKSTAVKSLEEEELQQLLFPPPNTILEKANRNNNKNSNNKPAQVYLDSYQQTRDTVSLVAKPSAWLIQMGEMNAWTNLQKREQNQQNKDEIRAALNTYTDALRFDAQSYLWTASADLKKQYIRDDRMPGVTAVVTADLDLRYLYRNQVLTAWEDAQAEWRYQQNNNNNNTGTKYDDLVDILQQAQTACDEWFRFIDERDVQEAMDAIELELEK